VPRRGTKSWISKRCFHTMTGIHVMLKETGIWTVLDHDVCYRHESPLGCDGGQAAFCGVESMGRTESFLENSLNSRPRVRVMRCSDYRSTEDRLSIQISDAIGYASTISCSLSLSISQAMLRDSSKAFVNYWNFR
jgi:hypothetical protein